MAEDVRAEIVASVLEVVVHEGDQIGEGDTLVLLESMKMEIPVLAEVAGTAVPGPADAWNRQWAVGKEWLLGGGRGDPSAEPDGGNCRQRSPYAGFYSVYWASSCRIHKHVLGQRNSPQI